MAEKLAPEKRHKFVHAGKEVFEWDQTIEEVNIYIPLPPNVPNKLFHCKIQSSHIEVGIKGNPPYLNHDLASSVKTDSSFWTLEDRTMHVTLQKRDKGQTWPSPVLGQGMLDPYSADLEQKRLMLQRFQEENPGFDFSQAQFNGNCPDPRTFMGGISGLFWMYVLLDAHVENHIQIINVLKTYGQRRQLNQTVDSQKEYKRKNSSLHLRQI